MKKQLLLFLTLSLSAITCASCGSDNKKESAPDYTTEITGVYAGTISLYDLAGVDPDGNYIWSFNSSQSGIVKITRAAKNQLNIIEGDVTFPISGNNPSSWSIKGLEVQALRLSKEENHITFNRNQVNVVSTTEGYAKGYADVTGSVSKNGNCLISVEYKMGNSADPRIFRIDFTGIPTQQ